MSKIFEASVLEEGQVRGVKRIKEGIGFTSQTYYAAECVCLDGVFAIKTKSPLEEGDIIVISLLKETEQIKDCVPTSVIGDYAPSSLED